MNRILVPVDFSDISKNALNFAIKLFGGSTLEITILHTYSVMSSSSFNMKSIDKIMERDAEIEMDALLGKLEKEEPNISFKSKILKSDAISTITSMANSGKYDFVVMGTKGASGLKEVFVGSVAGGVISKTKAPVIVVPEGCQFKPFKEMVIAISYTLFSDYSVIEPMRNLAEMFSCKVTILHIKDEEELDIEKVMDAFKDLDSSLIYASGNGNINTQLNKYIEKEEPDLLCLVRGKKGFFSRIFGESVTKKQTFNSPIPLLVLHD